MLQEYMELKTRIPDSTLIEQTLIGTPQTKRKHQKKHGVKHFYQTLNPTSQKAKDSDASTVRDLGLRGCHLLPTGDVQAFQKKYGSFAV